MATFADVVEKYRKDKTKAKVLIEMTGADLIGAWNLDKASYAQPEMKPTVQSIAALLERTKDKGKDSNSKWTGPKEIKDVIEGVEKLRQEGLKKVTEAEKKAKEAEKKALRGLVHPDAVPYITGANATLLKEVTKVFSHSVGDARKSPGTTYADVRHLHVGGAQLNLVFDVSNHMILGLIPTHLEGPLTADQEKIFKRKGATGVMCKIENGKVVKEA